MEKLELKHIAPYLPYEVKITNGKEIIEITTLTLHDSLIFQDEFKPILKPLPDLINDEKFINETNENLFCGAWKFDSENGCLKIVTTEGYIDLIYVSDEIAYECSYSTYLYLIENHYDIFGLIPKGLAISIHDVEK